MFNWTIRVLKLIRYLHWQEKIQSTLIGALVVWILSGGSLEFFRPVLLLTAYMYGISIYGYVVNSWGDRFKDRQVGKEFMQGFSDKAVCAVMLAGLIFSFFVVVWINSFLVFLLSLVVVFLATAYSLKPFRWKERGGWGFVVAGAAQRLPFLFLLFLLPSRTSEIWTVFAWLILTSAVFELAHQLRDLDADRKTDTRTLAAVIGAEKSIRWIIVLSAAVFAVPVLMMIFLRGMYDILPLGFSALTLFLFSHNPVEFAHQTVLQYRARNLSDKLG